VCVCVCVGWFSLSPEVESSELQSILCLRAHYSPWRHGNDLLTLCLLLTLAAVSLPHCDTTKRECHTHTHTHTHTDTHTHAYTHTYTYISSGTQTQTLSLSLSLTLALTHTHVHTLLLSDALSV